MRKLDNKGFTLIELIATIVILTLVVSIGGYAITNIMKSAKEEDYKLLIENVNNAVEGYYIECRYSSDNSCNYEITLGYLVSQGYLSANGTNSNDDFVLLNPKDNKDISNCMIKYAYSNGKFRIEPVNPSGSCPNSY